MAINRDVVEMLMKIIQNQEAKDGEENPEFKVYLKYAMRCLTMCLRSKTALDIFLQSKVRKFTFDHI